MELLILFVGVPLLLAGIIALSAGASIWAAWWAVKIWALLVVPTMHLPPLPIGAAIGFALVFSAMRPKDTSSNEKESAGERLATSMASAIIAPPLIYGVALLVSKWAL